MVFECIVEDVDSSLLSSLAALSVFAGVPALLAVFSVGCFNRLWQLTSLDELVSRQAEGDVCGCKGCFLCPVQVVMLVLAWKLDA